MQRTKQPTRKIWAQGELDSACFLYCLANAAFLLTSKRVTGAKWRRAISQMSVRADDFLSGVGTERIGDHPESLQKLADSFMKCLGVSTATEVIHRISSHGTLSKAVTHDQVVVLSVDSGNHWVVAGDISGSKVYYACSAQALFGPTPYKEDTSPTLGRIYNANAPFSKLDVWECFAIVLKRSAEE